VQRKNDPLYQSRDWRDRTSPLMRSYNMICMRIIDGVQCTRPSKVVHHLIAPDKAPALAMDWRNLVAVCPEHHPASRPGASPDEKYVDGYGPENAVYYHGHGPASWKPGSRFNVEQAGTPPVDMHTGNIGAQNAALASIDLDSLMAVKIPGCTT
jgi:hypothetical protein